jgi:putative transposase
MIKTYHYRIYPTKSQITTLNKTIEMCRKVYNNTLALRKNAWNDRKENISYFSCYQYLKAWKEEFPELKNIHSQVLQDAQHRVDLALKGFFGRVKSGSKPGFPRFKSFGRYNSISYTQHGFRIFDNYIRFHRVGEVKVIFHRSFEGIVKQINIKRTPTDKWFVSIMCDAVPEKIAPASTKCVGIDVGLDTFAMLSDGLYFNTPKFEKYEKRNQASAHKKFSHNLKNAIKRKKFKRVAARIYERTSNRRDNFIHQVSRYIINNYKTICFEKLDIADMIQNSHLAKSIKDASWGKLIDYTTYKAEEAGRIVVLVNPMNTSQSCSKCGKIVAKDLSVRIHNCPNCGLQIDRDLNAAINILRLGLQSLGKPLKALTYSEGVITAVQIPNIN